MPATLVVSGRAGFVSRLTGLEGRVQEALATVAPDIARFGESAVYQQASRGRPGPRVISGVFRESIEGIVSGTTIYIRSNAPQAARLEFGFYGYDSLGRYYQQPPYPSFTPAVPIVNAYAQRVVIAELRRRT